MTKRLQVLFEDDELRAVQAMARRRRQTTAAFVRDVLREARAAAEHRLPEAKLRAVREASAHSYPSGEMEQILSQVERGYLDPSPPGQDPATS